MMETAVRQLRRAPRLALAAAKDPVEAWLRLGERLVERREHRRPRCVYEVDADWEARLHELLGMPWPCPAATSFWRVWPEVIKSLEGSGLRIGPASFGMWNDGEPELVRAAWCLARHLRPSHIVETGVARGLTSRLVLQALETNGAGHLWSIDLPPPMRPDLHGEIGIAVGGRYRHRWSYIKGSSRRRLPPLLSRLGTIDLFIHDSMHTEHNVRFELERAWACLRPGGFILVDDIDLNWGFHSFTESLSPWQCLICQAEPLQPDLRRFDRKGLFGIICKGAAA